MDLYFPSEEVERDNGVHVHVVVPLLAFVDLAFVLRRIELDIVGTDAFHNSATSRWFGGCRDLDSKKEKKMVVDTALVILGGKESWAS